MKRYLVAICASVFAGGAIGQSSVTLFGALDLNLTHTRQGGASRTFMGTSGHQSSLLGFRGTEDLGQGRFAGFWLESNIRGTTGRAGGATTESSSAFFNRRATVSVGGSWGEVRLGRDYTPSFWNDAIFDPFGTEGIGSAHITAMRGTNWGTGGDDGLYVRSSNAVSWLWGFKPNEHPYVGADGFYAQLTYAFPSGSGLDRSNRYLGARLGYKGEAFNVAASYSRSKGPGAASPTDAGNTASGQHSSYQNWSLGGKYSLPFVALYAQYGVNKANVPGTRWTHWLIGATYPVVTGYFRGSLASIRNNDRGRIGLDHFSLGYVYPLSKRTSLYTTYSHLKPKGYASNGRALESLYPFNVGDDASLGDPKGRSGNAVSFGIAHIF